MGKINSEELCAEEKRLISEYSDLKTKFDFYLISLPFIALGMSISSCKITGATNYHLVYIEIASWLLFLFSGLFGLLSKTSYLKALLLNLRAVRSKLSINEAPEIHRAQVLTTNKWVDDLPMAQSRKLRLALWSDNALLLFFIVGFVALIVSRASAIFCLA